MATSPELLVSDSASNSSQVARQGQAGRILATPKQPLAGQEPEECSLQAPLILGGVMLCRQAWGVGDDTGSTAH